MMTPRQRNARINTLRKEYMRLLMAGRTTQANRVQKELATLVIDRMREQLGKVA